MNTRRKKLVRYRLIQRQGLECFYCHVELVEPEPLTVVERLEKMWATIDHILPRSAGGSNRMANLVLSCPPCHWERHGAGTG